MNPEEQATLQKIEALVASYPVVIFMKGTLDEPKCGFSMTAAEILKSLAVPIMAVDVLEDPEIRKAVKKYADWPTFPQVFIGGKFVGGADIVQELHSKGELQQIIRKASAS
ncbi:MAG: Grx4 family monothiol glutaredoxin [Nitrospirota bacterium]|nr:Grx4 family monothiol glutaredoxin [Nitrospirota bacterium]